MTFLKLLRVPALTAGLLCLTYGGISAIAFPGDRLYAFIYQRGFVQPTTISVFCLVVVLLLGRLWRYRRERAGLRDLASQKLRDLPQAIANRLQAVAKTQEKHGNAAALAHAERLAAEHEQALHNSYAALNYLAGALPALGLFGTMLGMSNGLFYAFASGKFGTGTVQQFVTCLGVAMDTTVLGMVCAAPAFACAWLLERWEKAAADQYAGYVRMRLGLNEAAHTDQTVDALRTELRSVAREMAAEAKSAFEVALRRSVDQYGQSLGASVAEIFSNQRAHENQVLQQVVSRVSTQLGEALQGLGERIEANHRGLTEQLLKQLGQLEGALRGGAAGNQNGSAHVDSQLPASLAGALESVGKRWDAQNRRLTEEVVRQLAQIELALRGRSSDEHRAMEEVVSRLSACLGGVMKSMGERMETHNRRLTEEMAGQLGHLEAALRNRTPEEIVIRYQHERKADGNGHGDVRELLHA